MTNEEFVRQAYAVAEAKDLKAWVGCFNPDGVFVDESTAVTYRGPSEVGKPVENYGTAFFDMHRELYGVYVSGDVVVVELALQGTHDGPLWLPQGTLPPTGNRMDAPCCDVFKLKNGRIQLFDCYPSGTVILGQLGVLGNLDAVLQQHVNEYLANIKRDRPDRFGGFAALPLPDIQGSLDQIEYALDVLELDGVSVMTNADRSYLGDSRFDPIFGELQRRAAVVFVHPIASPDPIAHTLGLPDTLLDYPVDTSRAIAKLHYSNTFARTPDIKYVFVHAGGTIPYLASRFAIVDEMEVIPGARERGTFADVLPRLYWDTASAFSDPVLRMLGSVTGLSNVVFGTDYPYPRDAISIGGLRHLENTAELDDGERRGVLGGSAARLIPRLARTPISRPSPPARR